MSTFNIPITECTGSIYKYPLEGTSEWLVVCVIDIPYSKKELQSRNVDNVTFTGTGMWDSGYGFSAASVGLDGYTLPVWSYAKGKTLENNFLNAYSDDNFILQVSTSTLTFMGVSLLQNKTVLGTNNQAVALTTNYSAGEVATTITITIFRFTDNEYLDQNIYSALNFISDFGYDVTSKTSVITDFPTPDKKGKKLIDSQSPVNTSLSNLSLTTDNKVKKFYDTILKKSRAYNPDNPYEGAGDDPDDPGQGNFDYSSDDVPIPDLPKTNVTDSGLVSLFAPDEGQLKQLAKFLWSDSFSLDSFKKIFNNPMDCILGLSILPIHLPHGGAKEITVGNIVSTVSCDTCSAQYVKLNCGSFTFSRSRFTGGYLDNAPYTRCYLYLPFIGTQEINIDEFMGSTLGVEYHIDILTGAMFCFVTRNSKLLLTYSGNCAENVPLSANDFTSTISSMLSMATVGAGAIATIATAGAAAPTTAGMASEALGARTASSLIGAGAQGASAVMNSKPNVSHSGSLGGGAGAMGQLYPYLIFIAPRPDIPTDQNSYTGFPSNKIEKIGNLKGFNVIEAVNLKVEGANDNEMSEIEAILKGGVII